MSDYDPLALGAMIAHCGWDPTTPQTGVEVLLNGHGTRLVQLPSMFVTDVTDVQVLDRTGVFQPLTVGPGGDVQWSDNGVVETCGLTVFPSGLRNVKVTYSGGFAPEAVPNDLDAALRSFSKRTSGPRAGATSARMGTAGFTYGGRVADGDFLVAEQLVFDRYRIPRSG